MSNVTERLLNLISENENIDALLSELTGNDDYEISKRVLAKPTFLGLLSLIQEHCKLTGSSVSSASAGILCDAVKSLVGQRKFQFFLESTNERLKLSVVMDVAKHFIANNQFSHQVFAKKLNRDEDICLPFEVVWMLHESSLMTLDLFFLCNLKRPAIINSISSYLATLCCRDDRHSIEWREKILYDVLAGLLKIAFTDVNDTVISRGLKKVSLALLDNILKQLISQCDKEQDVNLFAVLISNLVDSKSKLLDKTTLERYFIRQANIILSKNVDDEFTLKLFLQHKQWTYMTMNKHMRNLFEEIFVLVDVEKFLDILKKLLEQKELNWNNGLMFVSVALVCFPTFAKSIGDLAMEMLEISLQTQDKEQFASSVLLFRHCCIQGNHIYTPYNLWFKRMFQEGGGTLSNKKHFLFFIKFLTEIMPYESEEFIKVHVQNTPKTPAKCKVDWLEYVVLIKTHLSDIKESGQSSCTDAEQGNLITRKAETEIENALISYENNLKIPTFIIEMSLFSKPYFIGKFLPVLLKPRLMSDVPDLKMLFIAALVKSGKVSQSSLNKYELECKKMTLELVEGVVNANDDDDDDEMQILQLPLDQQLKISLNTLQDSVLNKSDENITKHMSAISEKLFKITKMSPSSGQHPLVTDLCNHQLGHSLECQVSHQILEFLLHTVYLEHQTNFLTDHKWIDKFILMLLNHTEIIVCFYQLSCHMLANKLGILSPGHCYGLAILIAQRIHADREVFGDIRYKEKSLSAYIIEILKFKNRMELKNVLMFVSDYVAIVKNKYEEIEISETLEEATDGGQPVRGIIPKHFIDIILYAPPRLYPQLRSADGNETLNLIESTEGSLKLVLNMFLNNNFLLIRQHSLSFKTWMLYELGYSDPTDAFSLLSDYYGWVINTGKYYLSDENEKERTVTEKYCIEIFEVLCCWNIKQSSVCSECVNETQNNVQHKLMCFLYLIQNLTSRVYHQHEFQPWLWKGVDCVLKKFVDREINESDHGCLINYSKSMACLNVMRLLPSLPSVLFFSSSSTFTSTPPETVSKGLEQLKSFINDLLRNSNPEVSLTLNLNFTVHVLEGLSWLKSSSLVEEFLANSPLLIFSICHHWSAIKLLDVYHKEESTLRSIFDQFDSVIKNCSVNFPTGSLPVVAGATCAGVSNDSIEVFSGCVQVAKVILSGVRNSNCAEYFDNILLQIQLDPNLFCKLFHYKTSEEVSRILHLSFPSLAFILWPCAIMSLFVHVSRKNEFRHSSDLSSSFISSVLECYIDFNEFFESADVDHSFMYRHPFVDISEASAALIDFLRSVPRDRFEDIDEKVFNKLDLAIRVVIGR